MHNGSILCSADKGACHLKVTTLNMHISFGKLY